MLNIITDNIFDFSYIKIKWSLKRFHWKKILTSVNSIICFISMFKSSSYTKWFDYYDY